MTRVQLPNNPSATRGSVPPGELVRCWQQRGDRRARDAIFEQFLPLARRLAWRYANPNEPMEDLVQVAGVGLMGAIDRFDVERGTPFAAFAIPTILGELRRYFRNTGWSAHVPRGAQEMALRVDHASREIAAQTGRAPRVSAIAEYLEVSLEDVLVGLDAGMAHYADSLDARAQGADVDEPHALIDTVGGSDDGFGLVEARLSVAAAINRLPFQQRRALSLRIDGDMRQADVASQLGCSQMQVSRLLRQAACTVRALLDPEFS
jgi:RNA polymerase sigma-B factor